MSGELILGAVVIVGVIIAGRMLSPVDHNINRVYLRRMLRACGELDPKENIRSLRAARIPIAATEEQNMERVYHRLSITTNRGRKQLCCPIFLSFGYFVRATSKSGSLRLRRKRRQKQLLTI